MKIVEKRVLFEKKRGKRERKGNRRGIMRDFSRRKRNISLECKRKGKSHASVNVAVSHGHPIFFSTKTSDRESIVETRLLVVCTYSSGAFLGK